MSFNYPTVPTTFPRPSSTTSSTSPGHPTPTTTEDSDTSPKTRKRNNFLPMIERACENCVRRKARCSGGEPCDGCRRKHIVCVYTPRQRSRGPRKKVNQTGPLSSTSGTAIASGVTTPATSQSGGGFNPMMGVTPTGNIAILNNVNHPLGITSIAEDRVGGYPRSLGHLVQQEHPPSHQDHHQLPPILNYQPQNLLHHNLPLQTYKPFPGSQPTVSRVHDLLDYSATTGRFDRFAPHPESRFTDQQLSNPIRGNQGFTNGHWEPGYRQRYPIHSPEDVSMNLMDIRSPSLRLGQLVQGKNEYPHDRFDGYPTNDPQTSIYTQDPLSSTSTLPDLSSTPRIQSREPAQQQEPTNDAIKSGTPSPPTFADRLVSAEGADVGTYQALVAEESPLKREDSGELDGEGEDEFVVSEEDLERLSDDKQLQKLCYSIYWCFIHPIWPIIYRPTYNEETAQEMCPLLHYAIMAVSVRPDLTRQSKQSQTKVERADMLSLRTRNNVSLGDIFYKRARKLIYLIDENDQGDIITCQALLLLTLKESGIGKILRGWTTACKAIGLAIALNLCNKSIVCEKGSEMHDREQEKRRVIWSLYVLDKLVGMMFGKPFMLQKEDILASLPSNDVEDEFREWASDAKLIIPHHAHRYIGIQARTVSSFIARIDLMTQMEVILKGMWRQQAADTPLDLTVELDESLVQWKNEYLAVIGPQPTDSIPSHLLMLRMNYNLNVILIHRPFIRADKQIHRPGGSTTSLTLCQDAADDVSATCRIMEEGMGIFRWPNACVYIIFQAGIVHLTQSSSTSVPVATVARKSFEECLGWIDQFVGTYGMALQYRRVLQWLSEITEREISARQALLHSEHSTDAASPPEPDLLNGSGTSASASDASQGPASIEPQLQTFPVPEQVAPAYHDTINWNSLPSNWDWSAEDEWLLWVENYNAQMAQF